jgi:hypothetical protein
VRASEARPAHLLLPPAAYSSLPPSFRARLSTKDRQHASETTSRHPRTSARRPHTQRKRTSNGSAGAKIHGVAAGEVSDALVDLREAQLRASGQAPHG